MVKIIMQCYIYQMYIYQCYIYQRSPLHWERWSQGTVDLRESGQGLEKPVDKSYSAQDPEVVSVSPCPASDWPLFS